MVTSNGSLLRMSLADVARAARVERPVVSMWRKRTNRAGVAFPQPVGDRDGHPEFDAHAVADFLRTSGLGNNPEAAEDVVAAARPHGALADEVSAGLVIGLLTLADRSNELIRDLDEEDLADLAATVDPDDRCLRREVESALPVSTALAEYVDQLAESAYSPRAAIEVVARDAARRAGGDHRRALLSDDATRLIATMAAAIGRAVGLPVLRFIDPTLGDGRILSTLADTLEEDVADYGVVDIDCAATRLARCRLLTRDVVAESLPVLDGDLDLGGPGVVVGALPSAGEPAASTEQLLDTLNDITLMMSTQHWGVLLAPSTVLTDRLPIGLVGLRDAVIRDGRLRMAVRLPTGLAPHQGQTHLAMWVFGPTPREVSPTDRGTVVADLSDVTLTDEVLDELTTDAVTSLTSVRFATRLHAFHRSTMIPTTRLLTGSASLVADATPSTYADPASLAELVERLRAQAGDAGAGWSTYSAGGGAMTSVPTITLGRAIRAGWVRVVSGHRIRERDVVLRPTGAAVIGPEEVAGRSPWGARRIGLLELAAAYPRAQLTEPGDVVFATGQQVGAKVDREGGSVVQSPARILRLIGEPPDATLLPEVLAADLVAQPVAARRFESWPIRLVPSDDRDALHRRWGALADAEARLQAELAAVQELQAALVDGVVTGSVRIADDVPAKSQDMHDNSADPRAKELAE